MYNERIARELVKIAKNLTAAVVLDIDKVNPGEKRYYIYAHGGLPRKSKHLVMFHNGESYHKDGSPFYDVKSFSRFPDLMAFVNRLESSGYREKDWKEY